MIREHYLPQPTSKIYRRRIVHSNRIPAFQHSDAIAKHMKGKGKGQHKTYRRMTKAHIPIKED